MPWNNVVKKIYVRKQNTAATGLVSASAAIATEVLDKLPRKSGLH
jgi:hypothetical protein